jgi:hypothetical protein
MRDVLDRWSWPLRRWACDRLIGHHACSRNVAKTGVWAFVDASSRNTNTESLTAASLEQYADTVRNQPRQPYIRFGRPKPFDQEYS